MSYVLPPKRFQQIDDPIYDSIRFKKWFAKLETRREKLPILAQAYSAWTCMPPDTIQEAIAKSWGVDARELRDYADFVQGESRIKEQYGEQDRKSFQAILDASYSHYVGDKASKHIRHYLEAHAALWGYKPRLVGEFWEIDPTYYPTGYKKP